MSHLYEYISFLFMHGNSTCKKHEGQWVHHDDSLVFLPLIKHRLYCSENEMFLGFDVGLFDHRIVVSLEENAIICQYNSDKSCLSFVYIVHISNSMTHSWLCFFYLNFIHSRTFFMFYCQLDLWCWLFLIFLLTCYQAVVKQGNTTVTYFFFGFSTGS